MCVCVCFGQQVEQVSQLSALIEAAVEYHRQSCEILEELRGKLQKRFGRAHFTLLSVITVQRSATVGITVSLLLV